MTSGLGNVLNAQASEVLEEDHGLKVSGFSYSYKLVRRGYCMHEGGREWLLVYIAIQSPLRTYIM